MLRNSKLGKRAGRLVLGVECLEDRLPLAVFHVAIDGRNSSDGSEAAPWRTLQHAAQRVDAGDTVLVGPGRYVGFDLTADGTAAQPIIFRAKAGAIVDRPNQRTPDGINLEGADFVVIEGFDVTGVPRAGIRSVINEGVVIRDNRAYDNGRWGIFTGFSENIIIQRNETSGSVREHGIYVSNSADGPIIQENLVWGNHASGIQINADATLGGDGIIEAATVARNIIYDMAKRAARRSILMASRTPSFTTI